MWNHIYQTREHKNLSLEDKKKFLRMTHAASSKDDVKQEVTVSLGDNAETAAEGIVVQDLKICTIGRQKFGGSRGLGCFKPDTPLLVKYRGYVVVVVVVTEKLQCIM